MRREPMYRNAALFLLASVAEAIPVRPIDAPNVLAHVDPQILAHDELALLTKAKARHFSRMPLACHSHTTPSDIAPTDCPAQYRPKARPPGSSASAPPCFQAMPTTRKEEQNSLISPEHSEGSNGPSPPCTEPSGATAFKDEQGNALTCQDLASGCSQCQQFAFICQACPITCGICQGPPQAPQPSPSPPRSPPPPSSETNVSQRSPADPFSPHSRRRWVLALLPRSTLILDTPSFKRGHHRLHLCVRSPASFTLLAPSLSPLPCSTVHQLSRSSHLLRVNVPLPGAIQARRQR